MTPDANPGRLERILSKTEEKKREPQKQKSYWARSVTVVRNRVVTGIFFLTPIIVTYWFVKFFVKNIYNQVEQYLAPLLTQLGVRGPLYDAVGIVLSLILVLSLFYLVGLITARRAVRRLIGLGEWFVVRIPFVKFFYKTTKQIVDTIAASTSGALQKVVVIEYPRPGIRTVAFMTGVTKVDGESQPYINLFVPTTPNPTSGYMVMLSPDQVFETNMTIEEAMKFIVSGGILPPDELRLRPFQFPTSEAPDSLPQGKTEPSLEK